MADQIQKSNRTPPARSEHLPPLVVETRRRWTMRETLVCFFLVAMIIASYFTVWSFEFVYFDDPGYVTDNLNVLRGLPLFRSPDRGRTPQDPPLTDEERTAIGHRNVEGFKTSVYWAFTAFEQSNWHPLTWLSHMLDIELYQQWTGGHHITNIILHTLNTLLLFGLFWRMTGMTWRSAAVAAMFAVHPMHVESVAWVAERKDVLSTFFGFLTLHAYVSYGRDARFNAASVLFAAALSAVVAMLGWLWFHQCFSYLEQVIWFQHFRITPAPNVFERFQQQCQFLAQHGVTAAPQSFEWVQQQTRWLEANHLKGVPLAYDGLTLAWQGAAVFAAVSFLALVAAGCFAYASGRTRLLKYCASLLVFLLVGLGIVVGLWGWSGFEGPDAEKWTEWFCVAASALAIAGGSGAAVLRRNAIAVQCGIFAASLAALLLVLHWIQVPMPQSPAQPEWYNNPFQTIVERIWCTEFAVAIFVVFGSLAVDAVWGRRANLGLFCVVFLLYVLGLLAKPMLVTLPFLMLLIDYWPLKRIDPPAHEEEKPAAPAEAARTARRRARERRRPPTSGRQSAAGRQPAAIVVQPLPGTSLWPWKRMAQRALFLVLEKMPLFVLAACSSMVTPIAQSHGGSMASASDLPIDFRVQNATKSFAVYIGKMFWPGKMMSLHLLAQDEQMKPYVEPNLFWLGFFVVVALCAVAGAAFYLNRRYVTFGWLWYIGTLVPVIGFVQVGEQRWADRYTYVPYIGLFVAIVWGIGELLDRLPQWRRPMAFAAAGLTVCVLATWISWTNFQIQTWHDRERHLRHALTVEPDNWNMLNNLGVHLWKSAQDQERAKAEAESVGNALLAAECGAKVIAFKDEAMAQWLHGIRARPTATDIHSNLGYAYSEKAAQVSDPDESDQYLEKAFVHLLEAVRLKDISPRPHNNLGRVLLRQSQKLEVKARAAEEKGMTAEATKLRAQAKAKLDEAIHQFERAVELDPTLLEAHLNLGEVYTQLGNHDKATEHYVEILKLDNPSVKDPDALANFSQAIYGLARIALAKNKPFDEAVQLLRQSIAKNPNNMLAIDLLASQYYIRGDFRNGDPVVWLWLSRLSAGARRDVAERFGRQYMTGGKITPQSIHAWGMAAWIFATSPEPQLRDPQKAGELAERIVKATNEQDPLALDTFAATAAVRGQFDLAVRAAQQAMGLANSQGNKPLAEAIAQRLANYQQQKPYISKPDGSDRP